MPVVFNADEVFQMAEDIERNAAGWYRKAAEISPDPDSKKMFLDFSEMETGHARSFAQMRKDLVQQDKEPVTYDPYEETVLYLQSLAQAHGWEGKSATAQAFTGNETPQEILTSAIQAEKEAVAFYTGIKDVVFGQSGKDKIERIIKEEMKHVTGLTGRLAALRS